MNDISFERLVFGANGEPLNPLDPLIKVLCWNSRIGTKFLADQNLKTLKEPSTFWTKPFILTIADLI